MTGHSAEIDAVERIEDCTCRRGELVYPDPAACPNEHLHWRHL